jgi:hypothetical protein
MNTWLFHLDVNESLLWNHKDEDLSLWWRHELMQWAAVEAQALGFDAYAVCDSDDVPLAEGVFATRR